MKINKIILSIVVLLIGSIFFYKYDDVFFHSNRTLELNKGLNKFNLKTHLGKNFNFDFYNESASVFFYGFTNCPDICPTTLADISKIISNLKKNSNNINFYFVSVDPETDTQTNLKNYLDNFNKKIIGITGEKANVYKFLDHMHVYYKKIDLGDDVYTFDHSSQLFLFKKNGDFFGTISPNEKMDIALGKLKAIAVQ